LLATFIADILVPCGEVLIAMTMRLLRQPPPTLLERLLGRRRARLVRRRFGLAAVGVGLALLRPKPRHRSTGSIVIVGAVLASLVIAGMRLAVR
jgi:hypothetical protein